MSDGAGTDLVDLVLPPAKRKAHETLSPAEKDIEEKGSSESDQVWGVDSFDGSGWDSSDEVPVDEEELEFYRYLRHLYKSRGFLLDKEMMPKNLFQGFHRLSLDAFFKLPDLTGRDYMKVMAQVAVDKYNKTENKTLTLDHIVRAVIRMSTGVKAYITFMARESPGGELVEYQAKTEKVWQENIHAILCRPAPKD
ncbi:hypothetical protein AALP_AA1G030600 [Arabis alpina]|uniref:Cystatin domain-containing protein n=1 Tax=Arabis alpina TaxID=50452 RepID=A0A087HKR4_ARAAL|nr:hypothetical protein AALP_AA1G030600 [Arabis alpina]